MEYVYVGRIVNTHGIRGEVRIITDFKYKEKALGIGKVVYIGGNKDREEVNSYRVHKQFSMITFKGINNINDVLKYKGKSIFTTREDLGLDSNEYLDEDLIGFRVLVDGECVGVVKDYIKDKFQDKIVVNKDEKEYLVPNVSDIIEGVDLVDGIILVKNIKGLLD